MDREESGRLRRDSGAVAFEILLVLPILTVTFFLLVQFACITYAQIVLRDAAFRAARSAAVWIPAEVRRDASGIAWEPTPRSPAILRAKQAAAYACTALSPALNALGGSAHVALPQVPLAAGLGNSVPDTLNATLNSLDRWRGNWSYAMAATNVKLELSTISTEQGDLQLVTAVVTYRAYLFVPFAGRVLGWASPPAGIDAGWGGFADMNATCTLPLELELSGAR
jgi:hypothetical protein